jgi:hypothetical protein
LLPVLTALSNSASPCHNASHSASIIGTLVFAAANTLARLEPSALYIVGAAEIASPSFWRSVWRALRLLLRLLSIDRLLLVLLVLLLVLVIMLLAVASE